MAVSTSFLSDLSWDSSQDGEGPLALFIIVCISTADLFIALKGITVFVPSLGESGMRAGKHSSQKCLSQTPHSPLFSTSADAR